MRSQITAFATLVLSLGTLGSFAQQQDLSRVEITTTKLGDGLYLLTGVGGNMGLSVGEDGALLVDDELGELAPKILKAIGALTPHPVRFVINTHWHFDHTGANQAMAEAGALLIAQDNVRNRMGSEQVVEVIDRRVPPSPQKALPVLTYDGSITFHMNGEEIQAFHPAPAHTDGDTFVRFKKANVIQCGDLYFNGAYPMIDVSAGGSITGMIAAVDRILALADNDTKIIPGHGPLGDKKSLASFREMLVQVRERVLPLVRSGKTMEEVLAAAPTKDFDAQWGKGFMNPVLFTKVVYLGLAREKKP